MRLEERNLFKMSSYLRNLLGTRKMINSASVTKDAVFNLFLTQSAQPAAQNILQVAGYSTMKPKRKIPEKIPDSVLTCPDRAIQQMHKTFSAEEMTATHPLVRLLTPKYVLTPDYGWWCKLLH